MYSTLNKDNKARTRGRDKHKTRKPSRLLSNGLFPHSLRVWRLEAISVRPIQLTLLDKHIIILERQSWKRPYRSLSPALAKKAEWGNRTPSLCLCHQRLPPLSRPTSSSSTGLAFSQGETPLFTCCEQDRFSPHHVQGQGLLGPKPPTSTSTWLVGRIPFLLGFCPCRFCP